MADKLTRDAGILSHQGNVNQNHGPLPLEPALGVTKLKEPDNKRCGKTGQPGHRWWGFKMVRPHRKTAWQFPRPLNIPRDPAVLLLDVHPEELQTCDHTETCLRGDSKPRCYHSHSVSSAPQTESADLWHRSSSNAMDWRWLCSMWCLATRTAM